jgi:predicted exporter
MRIFPIALIVIGALGVARYLGLIPVGMFHLIGPILLIALGGALFFRRPRRCGNDWRARDIASRSDGTRSSAS